MIKKLLSETNKSLKEFRFTDFKVSDELINSYFQIKMAYAKSNAQFNPSFQKMSDCIIKTINKFINDKKLRDEFFQLSIWQSGSGSQTNMNINEAIAELCLRDYQIKIHPNDDVNRGQSTNDTYPSAIKITVLKILKEQFLPSIVKTKTLLAKLSNKFLNQVKIGRTHLQDALPISFGHFFNSYENQIKLIIKNIKADTIELQKLSLGGTAVGNGFNTQTKIINKVYNILNKNLKLDLKPLTNKLTGLSSNLQIANLANTIINLTQVLNKLSNDLILMNSGPRCGLNEIQIESKVAGSSIMPGKTNPIQCEMLRMVCLYIKHLCLICNETNDLGQLELNTYRPILGYSIISSLKVLSEALGNFNTHCLKNIEINKKQNKENINNSLMLGTLLKPVLTYDQIAKAVDFAQNNNFNLKQACLKLKYLSEKEFDKIINKTLKEKFQNIEKIQND